MMARIIPPPNILVANAAVENGTGKSAEIRLDSPTGKLLGTLNLMITGGTSSFREQYTFFVSDGKSGGSHKLYLVFRGGANIADFKSFELTGTADRLIFYDYSVPDSELIPVPTITVPTPTPTDGYEVPYRVEGEFSMKDLVPNTTLKTTVKVTEVSKDPAYQSSQVLLIVGLYDKNNTMVNISLINKAIPYMGSETLTAGFKLPRNVDGYTARAFVWSDMNDMIPLSNVISIP